VIVPGFFPRHDPSPVVLDALRRSSERGARVASVCVGAFALALAANEVSRCMVAPVHRAGGQAQFMERPVPDDGPGLAATRALAIQEMHRSLTVSELAQHAGYSARTFARRFLAEVGTTPLRWLTEQRLLEARRLLEATELPIEEVARRCGLGTAANLRLHLARDASITPTGYRRAFRGDPTPANMAR
jgi:transcriptional regulator GlxA family with amidase domain